MALTAPVNWARQLRLSSQRNVAHMACGFRHRELGRGRLHPGRFRTTSILAAHWARRISQRIPASVLTQRPRPRIRAVASGRTTGNGNTIPQSYGRVWAVTLVVRRLRLPSPTPHGQKLRNGGLSGPPFSFVRMFMGEGCSAAQDARMRPGKARSCPIVVSGFLPCRGLWARARVFPRSGGAPSCVKRRGRAGLLPLLRRAISPCFHHAAQSGPSRVTQLSGKRRDRQAHGIGPLAMTNSGGKSLSNPSTLSSSSAGLLSKAPRSLLGSRAEFGRVEPR